MIARCFGAAPPTRVIDAQLVKRIARGYAGEADALQVEGLLARMEMYERALRHIAVYGSGHAARMAAEVMTGRDPIASGRAGAAPAGV